MKTCKDRCKLCHINQTGQITAWKETCIEFIKYEKYRLWATIHGFYWDFCSARISFQEKTWWKSSQWPSLIVVLCNALTYIYIYIYIYIWNLQKQRGIQTLHSHSVTLPFCLQRAGDSWWWGSLKMVPTDAYCQSTIPQKQFIIIIGGFEPPTKFSKRGWAWQDLNF